MTKRPMVLAALLSGCAAPSREEPPAEGYRGIEEIRILARGME